MPFPQPVIEKRGGNGFWGAGLAKNKFCTDMLGLFSPKTTINRCQGLMQVSCSNDFAHGDVVRRRQPCLAGDLKIQFTGVFPLINATDATLDCKNDLVSSQIAFSTNGSIIIQFFKSQQIWRGNFQFCCAGCLTLDPGSRIRIFSILDPGSWIQIFSILDP